MTPLTPSPHHPCTSSLSSVRLFLGVRCTSWIPLTESLLVRTARAVSYRSTRLHGIRSPLQQHRRHHFQLRRRWLVPQWRHWNHRERQDEAQQTHRGHYRRPQCLLLFSKLTCKLSRGLHTPSSLLHHTVHLVRMPKALLCSTTRPPSALMRKMRQPNCLPRTTPSRIYWSR